MAFNDIIVKAKAQGICNAIKIMDSKERQEIPNDQFVDDYCNLRKMMLEAHPELAAALPPEVQAGRSPQWGKPWCTARYVEILAYAEQIVALADAP